MLIFFQEILLQLFLWLLKLIDGIMGIFSAISGVANVNYNGNEVNIIEYLIGDAGISTVFWCVFILAIGITAIFTITAIIKNMIVNSRNLSSIIGKFFLSLLGTMAMLIVVIIGILISNAILTLVSEIFEVENTTKLSNAIFNACVGDWLNGYSVTEIDVSLLSVKDIFGDYNSAFFVFPTSWKGNGMVDPNTFLYLPAMIAGVGLVIALIIAIINLAKRVFEIIIMYIVMPLSMSTLALDDGARLKVWRETFITKIVLAYGTVFSVNVFALILPLITNMSIASVNGFGNSMFLLFMIVGGAMVIPAGQALFVRLFGQADDMHGGSNFLRSAFYGIRFTSLAVYGLAKKLVRGTAKAGKKIANHKRNGNNSESARYSDN